ncbi:DUF433 domain-containing protein [Massilia eurypsychrophila]|uniref:DUF433 domain-containing protein n=1 Tax=Massilia eurypsychrophila TaxID=1485217 RepID=A0A2G8THK0_9BURK|nr:DUF433 domain-containing protein [Massilia eurypsychrophila]PIL45493.1 DUF433 domain-containing protein [Massilia eurypsychrophila]
MEIIGTGIYPLHQAARLVGAEPRALRRWVQGYSRRYKGEQVRSEPLWKTQLRDQDLPDDVIGFRDLLELRMVAAFVRHGVDLKVIRATVEAASHNFGLDYPLTNQQFRTDGRRIFLQALKEASEEELLMDDLRKQFVFSDIIKPTLYEGIEYGTDGAIRWFPLGKRKTIVLDPALQFGTPVISGTGVPTDTIYASYMAEGRDQDMVARIFDLTPKMVTDAVDFEERLAA